MFPYDLFFSLKVAISVLDYLLFFSFFYSKVIELYGIPVPICQVYLNLLGFSNTVYYFYVYLSHKLTIILVQNVIL